MLIDYEAEYNNFARVPEAPAIIANWQRDSTDYRDAMTRAGRAELGVIYGSSARQSLDIFSPPRRKDAPVALYVHGGYWRAREPQLFSFVAKGLNEHNVIVALAGYDLAPKVSIGQIVNQVRKSCLFLWERYGRQICVFGHSAGGHITACMLATDWPSLDPTAPRFLVPAAYSISGLFDLTPFVRLRLNADLKLSDEEAKALSPVSWPAPIGCIFDAVVGGTESNEFLRQSQMIVREWGHKGVRTRYDEISNANHFTAISPLADPESAMVRRIVKLCPR